MRKNGKLYRKTKGVSPIKRKRKSIIQMMVKVGGDPLRGSRRYHNPRRKYTQLEVGGH